MRTLIFIGVLLVIAPSEINERLAKAREQRRRLREQLWNAYDQTVYRVVDRLEQRGIIRAKDYSTNKN